MGKGSDAGWKLQDFTARATVCIPRPLRLANRDRRKKLSTLVLGLVE
jgi:hypothetical protein